MTVSISDSKRNKCAKPHVLHHQFSMRDMTANKHWKHLSYGTRQILNYTTRIKSLHSHILAFQLPSKHCQTGWASDKRQIIKKKGYAQHAVFWHQKHSERWRSYTCWIKPHLCSGLISVWSFSSPQSARRTGRGRARAPPPRPSWAYPPGSAHQTQQHINNSDVWLKSIHS